MTKACVARTKYFTVDMNRFDGKGNNGNYNYDVVTVYSFRFFFPSLCTCACLYDVLDNQSSAIK